MINVCKTITADEDIYTATEQGVIDMLSIVNIDSTDATINVYRSGLLGTNIHLIAKNTIIPVGEAAYIDRRVIKPGQTISIATNKDVDIDLNII